MAAQDANRFYLNVLRRPVEASGLADACGTTTISDRQQVETLRAGGNANGSLVVSGGACGGRGGPSSSRPGRRPPSSKTKPRRAPISLRRGIDPPRP